jgi:hypothetical protein
MDDHYVQAFHGMVRDTRQDFGYELPVEVEHYVVLLLADHVDRPHWQPKPSFAETYLQLNNSREAKQLGDACLFMCGVFPEHGQRHGLNIAYYANMGKSSYHRASRDLRKDLFEQLADNFMIVSQMIRATTNPSPVYRSASQYAITSFR